MANDPLSERLTALAQDLQALSARGFVMEPPAMLVMGELINDMAGDAVALEGRRGRPAPLLLVINNTDRP